MQALADKVHIHLLQPEGYVDAEAEHLLSLAERQRAQAFRFPKDRDLYVAAHIFLRRVLSQYAPLAAAHWQFNHNAYGKPSIANVGYDWLQFNLSHTQGMIACAVVRGRAVGVDIEQINRLCDLPSLCQYVLTPIEATDVLAASLPHEQTERFFTYWTLKEAYIKARGMGLQLPLQQFAFLRGNLTNWCLSLDPSLQNTEENWQFNAYRAGNNYCLAYCVQTDLEAIHASNALIILENSSSSFVLNSDSETTPISCWQTDSNNTSNSTEPYKRTELNVLCAI